MRPLTLLAAVLAGVTVLACTTEDAPAAPATMPAATASVPATATPADTATPSAATEPAPPEETAAPTPEPVTTPGPVRAEPLIEMSLERPVDAVALPGGAVLIAEQGGLIYRVQDGAAEVVLDITDRVRRQDNEEGLLSIALDPGFAENGHLWTYYSASNPRRTVLSRFEGTPAGAFDAVAETIVLQQEQPFGNHNGGAVRFGPDGMLYLGLGDGGSGGDPMGHGQDPSTLLGSIVRLDVSRLTEEAPYRVPADNPFVAGGGRAEVWAYGLRNPWRMAFDPATGRLWVADVGQNRLEEVSIATAGANLGWNIMEGHECYQAADCDRSGLTMPVISYQHGAGRCSITGGVVARDVEASNLEGTYVYSDFCSGELWAVPAAPAIEGDGEPVIVASGLGNVTGIVQVGRELVILAFGRAPVVLRNE